jgi:hypothetical protein
VCDKNTRRGGGRSLGMTHSIPAITQCRQLITIRIGKHVAVST